MMLAYRLVRLIEIHAATLAESLLEKVQASPHTPAYRNVPDDELRQRVYEIYEHLGEWLLSKSDADIERRYTRIGARRAQQHVPFSELAWALILTRDNLWAFLKRELVMDRPVEIFGELEFVQLLEQFFDRATYYAAQGHERESAAWAAPSTLAKAG